MANFQAPESSEIRESQLLRHAAFADELAATEQRISAALERATITQLEHLAPSVPRDGVDVATAREKVKAFLLTQRMPVVALCTKVREARRLRGGGGVQVDKEFVETYVKAREEREKARKEWKRAKKREKRKQAKELMAMGERLAKLSVATSAEPLNADEEEM
jgi:hypothetical protein